MPFADGRARQLPEDSVEGENDSRMLADVFRAGWHGARCGDPIEQNADPCRLFDGRDQVVRDVLARLAASPGVAVDAQGPREGGRR